MSRVVPLSQIDRRAPEAGRIRLGIKSAKGAPQSIDKLRFTSPNRRPVEQIAARYGGQVKPWRDPKANPNDQFEVISTVSEIPVYLVPGGLNCHYELWAGGGVERRCDGEQCEIAGRDEMQLVACICDRQGKMECKPYTRLNVILPEVEFSGVWRLESKGWNSQVELPGMFDLIVSLVDSGKLVSAMLSVERRSKMSGGQKRNYVVPKLSITQTPQELAAGANQLQLAESAPQVPALPAGQHEDIVEAELVDDDLLEIEELLRADARYFGLDEDRFVRALRRSIDAVGSATDEQRVRLRNASARMRSGELAPEGFKPDGSIQWK